MNKAAGHPDAPATQLPWLVRLRQHSTFKYLFAGGLAFLVDLGVLALLKNVFDWPLWLATGTAFLLSFFFTYTIQRIFAFGSSAPHGVALLKYAALVGINTLATVAIVSLVNPTILGWLGGKITATALSTVWNYFAYRYWVFAETRAHKKD